MPLRQQASSSGSSIAHCERFKAHLGVRFGDPQPGRLVARVLGIGEVERGTVQALVGGSERTARNVLAACVRQGYLKSDGPKGRVRVAFP